MARAAPEVLVDVDVVIIGGGPIGLTLAAALQQRSVDVVVIESGDDHPQGPLDDVHMEPSGFPAAPNRGSRSRGVGGTASVWNTFVDRRQAWARLVRMTPTDFEPNEPRPDSRWPISYGEISAYYERAYLACGVLPASAARVSTADPDIGLADLQAALEVFVPARRFTDELPQLLRRQDPTSIVTGATATRLRMRRGAHCVDGVDVVLTDGTACSIAARRVVLAAGGIENARLLMVSGFESPAIGRYFNDHFMLSAGRYSFTSPEQFDRFRSLDLTFHGGDWFMAKMRFTDDFVRGHEMLNVGILIRPTFAQVRARGMRSTLRFGTKAVLGASKLAILQRTMRPKMGLGSWSRMPFGDELIGGFVADVQIEQAPDIDNRVVLGSTIDRFGMRRVRIVNQLGEPDRKCIETCRTHLAAVLGRAGIDIVPDSLASGSTDVTHGMAHHMSTTRMHADPSQGVVDADCRVHGTNNLFCAGTSVFTTGGYANPTLTAIALGLRLADLVAEEAVETGGPTAQGLRLAP